MPRSTKSWMTIMETADTPIYIRDTTSAISLSIVIGIVVAFTLGLYWDACPLIVQNLLTAGTLAICFVTQNSRSSSSTIRTSKHDCVDVLASPPEKDPLGTTSLNSRSRKTLVKSSKFSNPFTSPPALRRESDTPYVTTEQRSLSQRKTSLNHPLMPCRSASAVSFSTFARESIRTDTLWRDSGYASLDESDVDEKKNKKPHRTLSQAADLYKSQRGSELTNEEIVELCIKGVIPAHSLEKILGNDSRAIYIRRNVLVRTIKDSSSQPSNLRLSLDLPFEDYDFSRVRGRCAENVIGYMPLPVGISGPLKIDGKPTFIPMATTEGTLIASTSRGCKALNSAGGVTTVVLGDGMTRAPVVRFSNISDAAKAKRYIESDEGIQSLREAFNTTTNHGELLSLTVRMAGCYLYLRFKASTGEAMGMNIIGKGVNAALVTLTKQLSTVVEETQVVSLSGNYCSDKKPSAINWIEGRGKSVVAEALIPEDVVSSIFRCSVDSLVALNTSKSYVGSALAGVSAGGFNAHAANIVTALFLATGQDPAQNVESSNCITMMEKNDQGSLQVSVSMPSLEVGTIGGGTDLAPQAAMLNLLGVKDDQNKGTGENAAQLARVIAAAVLAGELSLCAALATGDLIKAHMDLNRK